MAQKYSSLPTDKLISLVLAATEQLLDQSDSVVDCYRQVFFSGANPDDIAQKLGDLGSELVKLADVAISLSTLNQSVDAYEALVDKIIGVSRERTAPFPRLSLVQWPDSPTEE